MPHYLVVAHQTADSEELVAEVSKLAAPDATFTLLVPATPVDQLHTWTEGEAHAVAEERAGIARAALEGAGANVVATQIGDASPFQAVQDELIQHRYDTIVVSTFPLKKSRWIRSNLVERLRRAVDVPIVHVVAASRG